MAKKQTDTETPMQSGEWSDTPPTQGGRYEYDPATKRYRQVESPTRMPERPAPAATPLQE